MSKLVQKYIVLDLDHIVREYAKKNLRSYTVEYEANIVIDTGKREVAILWYTEEEDDNA